MFQKMSDFHFQAPNLHHPGQKQTMSKEMLSIDFVLFTMVILIDGISVKNIIKSLLNQKIKALSF